MTRKLMMKIVTKMMKINARDKITPGRKSVELREIMEELLFAEGAGHGMNISYSSDIISLGMAPVNMS